MKPLVLSTLVLFLPTAGASQVHEAHRAILEPPAPKIYVARCGFVDTTKTCGAKIKETVFMASDEFLSYTPNWAVGRLGSYKLYMSCFGPGDAAYIDGTKSALSVVVAGPELLAAHEHARQLLLAFGQTYTDKPILHCLEP